jgi:hypothetical protein
MKKQMLAIVAILALGSVCAMWTTGEARHRYGNYDSGQYDQYGRYQGYRTGYQGRILMPAGTSFNVRLDSQVSTENNESGDTWNGTVTQSVIAGNRVVIPAGTPVQGIVTNSVQGTHNTRPSMQLAVNRVEVDGRSQVVNADTEPIVAGSNRAKKLGVIAGGAAAGALLGHTVARGSHGTLIGGILGGAAGYGLSRHALRTMQLKPGTVLTFTTRSDVLAYR